MEQELFGRMERIRTTYLKLLGEFEARQANVGNDLEVALKELSAKEDELGNRRGGLVFMEHDLVCETRKWIRGELVPEELNSLRSRIAEIAIKLARLGTSSQVEKLDKKRRRLSRG
ncbi:uncharacterized protein A4U43_C09F14990 [Asparagus officinalis]|uniref:Uncharacterized protein n=1 Tax=Asparagus officinalis TaxID=4686 RepID=A0A5P1ECH5_ASPOF|nr:uncharacterized protein A4U43_C09F14990 [Asparagus officinalis]